VLFLGPSVLRLLGVDDTDNPDMDQAADMSGRIHQHHDVERVAASPRVYGINPKRMGASKRLEPGLEFNRSVALTKDRASWHLNAPS
jgi:hypothetical protein